tara:strand:+ start:488 stop:787 length:300 start_codon:yes stop_codon:yes gene_type:complete
LNINIIKKEHINTVKNFFLLSIKAIIEKIGNILSNVIKTNNMFCLKKLFKVNNKHEIIKIIISMFSLSKRIKFVVDKKNIAKIPLRYLFLNSNDRFNIV